MTLVTSDITANVWQVRTEVGAVVAEGDELVILESMKMEIPVTAPRRRPVTEIRVAPEDPRRRGRRHGGAGAAVTVHDTWHGAVLELALDRPERRNAVDHDTLVALADGHAHAVDARAVVLTGRNGVFCAGADLTGVEGDEFGAALARPCCGASWPCRWPRSPRSTAPRSGPAASWRWPATCGSPPRAADSACPHPSSG